MAKSKSETIERRVGGYYIERWRVRPRRRSKKGQVNEVSIEISGPRGRKEIYLGTEK